jgi:DNA-binding transcriptional LysR family regulator
MLAKNIAEEGSRSMEIQEIRYFLALAETLNFTRAAERCNVSQPALTRAIRHLEDKLGGPLVHRERGNTHLTELGRIMHPYFREVVEQLEEARKHAKSISKLDGARLTVGLMCTIGPHRLVELFSAFREANASVEIHMKDAPASQLEEALLKGDIDVALFCRPELCRSTVSASSWLWVPATRSSGSTPFASRTCTIRAIWRAPTVSTRTTCALYVRRSAA